MIVLVKPNYIYPNHSIYIELHQTVNRLKFNLQHAIERIGSETINLFIHLLREDQSEKD